MEAAGEGAAVPLAHLLCVLFPLLAAFFFRSRLVKEDFAPAPFSELSFIGVLTLSIHMHLLIILDILQIGSPESRVMLMRADIYLLTGYIFTVVPMQLFAAVTDRFFARSFLMSVFAFLIRELGNSVPLMTPSSALSPPTLIEHLVGRASFLGVTSMAMISGFGAIKAPIDYLSFFSNEIVQGDSVVGGPSAEERIRRKLVLLTESISAKKVRFLLSGLSRKSADAKTIQSMETLASDLFSEHVAIKKAQRDLHYRKTTIIGRFSDLIGFFYLGYCVYKLFMSSINIVFDRDPKTDPITRGFEIGLKLLPFAKINVVFWSQFISFVLVGVLVFSSVRGFVLLTLQIFSSFAAPKLSDVIVLFFAFILGLYFISSMALMRSSLPLEYRAILNASLGANFSFNLFHRWFDFVFVVSASITLVTSVFFRWQRLRLRETLKGNEPADPRLARGRGSSILASE